MKATDPDARRAKPGPRVLKAEDVYAPRRQARGATVPPAEWAFRRYPPVFAARERPDLSGRGRLDESVTTYAEVNHGRWVARCPFCPSAQVVTPSDPRFLCAGADGCANGPVRGAFVSVVFPTEAARDRIEAVLLARPELDSRNWRPGETVARLREENAANGLDNA